MPIGGARGLNRYAWRGTLLKETSRPTDIERMQTMLLLLLLTFAAWSQPANPKKVNQPRLRSHSKTTSGTRIISSKRASIQRIIDRRTRHESSARSRFQ